MIVSGWIIMLREALLAMALYEFIYKLNYPRLK